ALAGHVDVVPEPFPQLRHSQVVRCRQHGEHVAAVAPEHDGLGDSVARHVAGLCRAGGRHRVDVRNLVVLDVFCSQITVQCGCDGHDATSGAATTVHRNPFALPDDERLRG